MTHPHRRDGRLRIAQVAPLFESVPPQGYGGTERVASYLTEELVRLGHDVTLFASGDSVTTAKLIPCCRRSLRLDPDCKDQLSHQILMLEHVARMASRFDVLHFHIDYLHYPLSRRLKKPRVTTLHGRLDLPDLQPLYEEFRDQPVVSISDHQRKPLPHTNWQATVYHGLPPDLYTFRDKDDGYLAFLGRISPEKRPDRAIEIALKTGMKLRMAAKVDKVDREYHETHIQPLIDQHPDQIEFLGEVNGKAKDDFLGGAAALLFPIDWPEPFGLVMIEAMACGTPVIAYRRGSVPEVLQHGVTGYLVETQEEAIEAVRNLPKLSRHECRRMFEKRFLAERMARDYLNVYHELLERQGAATRLSRLAPPVSMDSGKFRPRHIGGSSQMP